MENKGRFISELYLWSCGLFPCSATKVAFQKSTRNQLGFRINLLEKGKLIN